MFSIVRSKESLVLTFGQLVEYYKRKISSKRWVENEHKKLLPDPYLIFVNGWKYGQWIQDTLLEIIYFLI